MTSREHARIVPAAPVDVPPKTRVQAHRGSVSPGVEENTLAAFAQAISLGADGIELDVHTTADGVVVVHHDAVVPGLGAISLLERSALPAAIPSLHEVLDLAQGITVNVEIKNLPTDAGFDPDERTARAVAEIITRQAPSDIVVSSFWMGALDVIRATVPSVPTGFLVAPWLDREQAAETAVRHDCQAFHPHESVVDAEFVAHVHAIGLEVAVWTVVDRTGAVSMASAGVDTIITDDVTMVREVLHNLAG